MSFSHLLVGANPEPVRPEIRRITPANVWQALARGFDDFSAMPSHAIFLCVIYPLVGLLLILVSMGHSMLPLAFPLAAGFALIGPFAAIGLYELSRRREAGLDTSSGHAFDVLHSPSLGAIFALGLLLTVIFLTWLAVANAIYVANFGYTTPASIGQFVRDVFTTSAGWSSHRRRYRCRLPFRRVGAHHQRCLFSAVARSRRRRSGRTLHVDTLGRCQPSDDGIVGPHRGGPVGRRLGTVFPWPHGGHAGARPRHVAPLSRRGRAGFRSACGISAAGTQAALRGRLSSFALSDAPLATPAPAAQSIAPATRPATVRTTAPEGGR